MTAIETLTAPAVTRRTALNRALWVTQILMSLFFLVGAAIPKLVGEATAVQMFNEMGPGTWFRYLIGTLELCGAIGLVVPRLTRAAAVGLAGLMIGAVYTQIVVLDQPVWAVTPAILLVVFCWIAWGRLPQARSES